MQHLLHLMSFSDQQGRESNLWNQVLYKYIHILQKMRGYMMSSLSAVCDLSMFSMVFTSVCLP